MRGNGGPGPIEGAAGDGLVEEEEGSTEEEADPEDPP